MKRRLKIAALSFGLFVLLVLSFLGWIIYTEAGLQFAVSRLPEKLGRVTLRIEDVRGTIAGGFRAVRVDVNHERSHVYIENASARVNFWPLLVGRISVRRADADLVLVEVKRRLHPPPDTTPRFLPRLLSISAERATAKSLVIVAPNGKRVEFSAVNGAGIVGHKTIRIFEGDVVYGVLHTRATGVLRAAISTKLSGESTTRMIIEGQPEWLADASFDGDLNRLPVTGTLLTPFRADFHGDLLDLSTNFHWQGKADVHNFDLRAFGAGGALGIVSGTLDMGGEMNAFHAHGPLLVPGLGAGLFDVGFEGSYADARVNATHYGIDHRATGSHVDGAGTIEVVENGPKLALAGQWSEVRWPLAQRFTAENPQIFSTPSGSYTLEGVWPYALTARGGLYVPQLEPMTFAMHGALHKDHLAIDELDLSAFDGRALLAGNARWTPDESWELEGDMHDFNPAELRPGFSGALNFHLKASGAPFGGDNLDFAFRNLSGRMRGNSAGGSGRVIKHGEDWTFEALRLRAGTTRLSIDGHLGPTRALDLDFSLDADNLGLLAEGARGTLHADGTVAGSSGAPVIRLNAQGSGIKHEGVLLDRLDANIDIDWRGQRASHADVTISGLTVDDRVLTRFNAVLDGTTSEHAFRLDALAGRTSPAPLGQGIVRQPGLEREHRGPFHRRHGQHQPAARRAGASYGQCEDFIARLVVPARQDRAIVRSRRVERRPVECARRRAKPADQHPHRGPHAERGIPGNRQCVCERQRQPRHAVGGRSPRRSRRRRDPTPPRQRAHGRHQLRFGLGGAARAARTGECGSATRCGGSRRHRGTTARRSHFAGSLPMAAARATADGHRRTRLHHAVRTRDRSGQRTLRREPELRRHARATRGERSDQALRCRTRFLPAEPGAARAGDGGAHRLEQSRVQLHRQCRQRQTREFRENRVARGAAVRRPEARRREPAPGRRARGAH
jgi:hypothetical protein